MNWLGVIHLTSAIASLALGAAVLLFTTKGSRRHRQAGWTYVVSMLVLNATALMIYRLFGGFGPFHVAALASLVTLVLGVVAAVQARRARERREPAVRARWVERHYYWMAYSYVGLAAAAVAEIVTRVPAARPRPGQGAMFAAAVIVASVVVFLVGAYLVRRNARWQLTRFQPHPRS
jgi:uncharacterized membrane protein